MNVQAIEQNAGLRGHWRLDVFEGDRPWKRDAGGVWVPGEFDPRRRVETIEGENLVVTVGKQLILDRLFGLSAVGAMTRMGVGTSSTAAALGNTSLTGSVFKAFDATPIRTATAVDAITTFGTADANINWNELGMDNGTTLLNRIAPIGPFNKTSAVSIVVTVTLTQN